MLTFFLLKYRCILQCAYSRTGGETTVDQPDIRGFSHDIDSSWSCLSLLSRIILLPGAS